MASRKLYTLVLLRKGSDILLGMKKRGFGEGKWNGFGGKVEAGETVQDAALRELHEESGLIARSLQHVGRLDFEFAGEPTIMEVHVFTSDQFEGEPSESEEMNPKWFAVEDIPYHQMWAEAKEWFPIFLRNDTFQGYFYYKTPDDMERFILSEGLPPLKMNPRWFGVNDIPFNQMWPDDSFWFPLFLKGAKFQGYFFFKDMDTIGYHTLSAIEDLPSL